MFLMIFVNDLSGAGDIVPDWMVHFSERHRSGSGMTFVDLVFPAFIFIMGMSIPFALGAQLRRHGSLWKIIRGAFGRMLSLLVVGVLMVNEAPDPAKTGCAAALWSTLMYLSALAAFCEIRPGGPAAPDAPRWRTISVILRLMGCVALGVLAFVFVGPDGHRIITLAPFTLHHEWWGILGLIGWAYGMAMVIFLVFRGNRTALLASVVLLFCLYPADQTGAFDGCWLARHVGFGATLGSQAAIAVGGVLLGAMLLSTDVASVAARVRFTLWFIAGTALAAWLLNGLYGISKNSATPSWCLWACAITAAVWLLFYWLADVGPGTPLTRILAVTGQNVLLAYLLSEMLPSALDLSGLGGWYAALAGPTLFPAIARSVVCAAALLGATVALNRAGFRLKI